MSISRLRRVAASRDHAICRVLVGDASNMGQIVALGVLDILQQSAGSAEGQPQFITAKAFQVVALELSVQGDPGALDVEFPTEAVSGLRRVR